MTVLLFFTKIYYTKLNVIYASVRITYRITEKSGYLAIVAYDVTMCLCIHKWHYTNYYRRYLNIGSIRKVVVVNIRILL